MAIQTQKIEPHWNYFLTIERDLTEISRYVEFDKRNFRCFSIEFARILLASGAEVDVVCKQICRNIQSNSTANNILDYQNEILPVYANIPRFQINVPRFGLSMKPWSEWRKPTNAPKWWTAYNKTKHNRDLEYYRANLKNALNSVAGLYIMVLYLYKNSAENGRLFPHPQLFRVEEKYVGGGEIHLLDSLVNYTL
jgi:DNA modification methylase